MRNELIRYNYQIKRGLTWDSLWNSLFIPGPVTIVSYGPIVRDEIALFRLERYIENVIYPANQPLGPSEFSIAIRKDQTGWFGIFDASLLFRPSGFRQEPTRE